MNCSIAGCGRPLHAAGLCRSHYAKRNRPDARAPIKARRPPGSVKRVMGFALSLETAEKIRRAARKARSSEHAVIVGVLERWAGKQ